jgi:hypothetical protein
MNASALDIPALLLALVVAVVVAASLIIAHRGGNRRGWVVAGVLALALVGLGAADIQRAEPRETHVSTVATGVLLSVLGSLGMVRGTRRVRPWLQWLLTVLAALVLLLAGLLLGAAFVSRFVKI